MSYLIQFPGDPDGLGAVGAKAGTLAVAQAAGIAVPPWFVVTSEAFGATLTRDEDTALHSAATASTASSALETLTLHPAIEAEIEQAVSELRLDRDLLALRPSPGSDDIASTQPLDAALSVNRERIGAELVAVWREAFSERALIHRRTHGLHLLPEPPAVIVQQMLRPQAAGVAFGADIVTGQRTITVIASVYGLATALKRGETNGDLFRVDRTRAIVRRDVADKRYLDRASEHAESGLVSGMVALNDRTKPSLTDTQIIEVSGLVSKLGAIFARPQEIEWAYDGGRLYLLGSKPIAGLDRLADPDVNPIRWDSGNVAEFFPGVTSPLTFSFARRIMAGMARSFGEKIHVSTRTMKDAAPAFDRLIGHIHGRVYANVASWYRVFGLLPDYPANARFYGRIAGQTDGPPSGHEVAVRPNWLDRLRVGAPAVALAAYWLRLPLALERFHLRAAEIVKPLAGSLDNWRLDELVAAFEKLERGAIDCWAAPLANDFYAIVFYGFLSHAARSWCGDTSGALVNDLLTARSIGGIGEPVERLIEAAAIVAKTPGLSIVMADGRAAEVRNALDKAPSASHAIGEFLHDYGERGLAELKFESQRLADDPQPVYRAIARLTGTRLTGANVRDDAEIYVTDAIGSRPVHNGVFQWLLRETANRIASRERAAHERARLFAAARRLLLEIGKRYYAIGLLANPSDILYLDIAEALGVTTGGMASGSVASLAAARKAEHELVLAQSVSTASIESRGPASLAREVEVAQLPLETRQGAGCCRGVVSGRVRYLTAADTAVEPGDILIAPSSEAMWPLLYSHARAIVFEQGGPLSHGAVAARSLGIPTVTSVPGVESWLSDGDEVEIDGATGVVTRRVAAQLLPPETAAHPMSFLDALD